MFLGQLYTSRMTTQLETPLTDAEQEQWHRDGYITPVWAMSPEEMAHLSARFEREFERGEPHAMNRHCDLPAIGDICRNVDLWGRLATLLGPDLILWRTNLFLGNPQLEWHEDQHARLLGGGFGISALLAMVDGSNENCTLLAPGSHRMSAEQKERRYGLRAELQAGGNIRYKGNVVESDFIRMPLRAGQCLIFHPELLHASSGILAREATPAKRLNIVLRVTSAGTRIAPAAYAPSLPYATKPILIRGVDRQDLNEYDSLA